MSTCGSATHIRWSDKLPKVDTLMAIYYLRWLKCHLFYPQYLIETR